MTSNSKLRKENVQDLIALSSMQEGILFHYISNPETTEYFSQLSLNLSGQLKIRAFEQAWKAVVDHNPQLRTIFRWTDLKNPIQIILKEQELLINEYDLTSVPAVEVEAELKRLRSEERQDHFDLATGPLFRISLCYLPDDQYEMIINNHHIIYDGWSMGIILQEFFRFYNTLAQGQPVQLSTKPMLKEYLQWLNKQDQSGAEEYWENYLKGFQNPTLLPVDYPKTKPLTQVQNQIFKLPAGLTEELKELAQKMRVKVSSLINTAWGLVLQRYNDTDQSIFGLTVSGRPAEFPGIEELVGLLINTIPVILKTQPEETLAQVITKHNQESVHGQDYEYTALSKIKASSELDARTNLFDSILVIENFDYFEKLNGLENALKVNGYTSFEMPNYDLTVEVVLLQRIEINYIYNQDLFAGKTIERIHSHLVQVLQTICQEPELSVGQLAILSPGERERLLFDFNQTEHAYEENKLIHQRVEEQAAKTPDQIAVEYGEQTITYGQLNRRANRLARYLKKQGVTPETVVAVMLERSIEVVVTLLAVLKAGGAYLPINPEEPKERINHMLKDADVRLILTSESGNQKFNFTALKNFEANQFELVITNPRQHIEQFNALPIPDRSLIDLTKYKNKIGMASVNNCITLQTTRGCPYHCLYCHKIWSKYHVHRSAEHIFQEIQYYHQQGVTNFAIIDDCFNLDMDNGKRLFELIIKHGLDVQIFFPNGLRGDILTPEFIDLMVAAGTRGINLSLESASPKMQKMIKKHLNLEKFKEVVNYIATRHPQVVLEMATMHGFPGETREDALMTLNFIKDIQWIDFPYVHILKIFPNTEMEEFALREGIAKEDILKSRNLAFHELPETLPFPKSFTREYQSNFLNEYFLNHERLKTRLPYQMQVLDTNALLQKYDAYLPAKIEKLEDLLEFAGIEDFTLPEIGEQTREVPAIFTQQRRLLAQDGKERKKVLMLDLSQLFSTSKMLYKVVEQPLGLIYLLTYIHQQMGDQIEGRIYKSGNDFDSFAELKELIEEFNPDLIGIRTLTLFKEFFHETVSLIRQWGIDVPIITGGPYASSDFDTLLQDTDVDLVVFGEGEYIFAELLEQMLEHDFTIPSADLLRTINGIGFAVKEGQDQRREVLYLDRLSDEIAAEDSENLQLDLDARRLAYVMYTSGSTGLPKGVMVEHRQVNNCIDWMQREFPLKAEDRVVQRTNLTFDPSVWEIFWPLYVGGRVKILNREESKNAEFLIELIQDEQPLTLMYCPASLVTAMTYILQTKAPEEKLRLPYFLIGAEPIQMDVVQSFYQYFEGQMVNTYGPTETTINNTYYYLHPDDQRSIVPIGKPIANNQIYILSKDRQLAPLKVPGEIWIGGASLARGYINNPEKITESFIPNPFGPGRIYRTGDIGRWLDDGQIEIMGRVDHQTKIRGYRIEPGEIEAALLKHPAVTNGVVIVRDQETDREAVQTCKVCGIDNSYPGITINEDGVCNYCLDLAEYQEKFSQYFKNPNDLEQLLKSQQADPERKYDCLLVYNGGAGATYALYKLVEMGVRVLAVSYNNGYLVQSGLDYMRRVTQKLGVDYQVLTHQETQAILKASLEKEDTVCHGCFLTSSALGVQFAKEHQIKYVVGATLSRGQILQNKLLNLYKQGVAVCEQVEQELGKMQRQLPALDEEIFQLIGIEDVINGEIYDQVQSLDFYRYFDLTNQEMLDYLIEQDEYWKHRTPAAIYSTKCPLKQPGDYAFMKKRGHHYYGAATSWEQRLGHIGLENVAQDLQCGVTKQGYENFLRLLGYERDLLQGRMESKYLALYYESAEEIPAHELQEYLAAYVPEYMIPQYITRLDHLVLDANGKVDRKALPKPTDIQGGGAKYVKPRNELEEKLVQIIEQVLQVENVGIQDSFFAVGGNSLTIIKLTEEVNKLFTEEIKVMDLFKYHSIERFVEFYQEKYGQLAEPRKVAETPEQILARFAAGEITMEEADRLIASTLEGKE